MIHALKYRVFYFFNIKDDCRLIRDCISGYIYDSSPVDFTSDLGRRFLVHPSVLKISHTPSVLSWMANVISDGFDAVFLNRFESQRAEYWQTLYSSVVSSLYPNSIPIFFAFFPIANTLSFYCRAWGLLILFCVQKVMSLLHIKLFAISLKDFKSLGVI